MTPYLCVENVNVIPYGFFCKEKETEKCESKMCEKGGCNANMRHKTLKRGLTEDVGHYCTIAQSSGNYVRVAEELY